jgi:hypothetical protein
MNSAVIAPVIFACTFGAALLGVFFRSRLPENQLDTDSADTVKLVMGLIATLTALVLGLLISSAHSAYNAQSTEVQQLGVHIYQIDRILAQFGPDAAQPRALLRKVVAADIERTWRNGVAHAPSAAPLEARREAEELFTQIASLSPTTNLQRFGQARVLELLTSVGETRRLLSEQAQVSLSWLFLIILGAWLTLLFFGFGLFARLNRTVIVALLAGAVSVAAAVFLILEMHQPYHGWMQVSSAPLRNALSQMNE